MPIQPLLIESGELYGMFSQWRRFPWVLPLLRHRDDAHLETLLDAQILPEVKRWEAAERALASKP